MSVVKYIYDGDTVLQETDGVGVALREYTSTADGYGDLLSGFDGSAARYYEPDALGSTDALSDDAQALTDRWRYRAFGAATHTTGVDPTSFTWVGRQGYVADAETGLYQLGSGTRYYDPQTAQFLSEDPIGFGGGDTNLRRYASNNPANVVDPNGLSCQETPKQPKEAKRQTCDGPFMLALGFAFERFMNCKAASNKLSECQDTILHDITIGCDDTINADARWVSSKWTILINPNPKAHNDRTIDHMVGMILFEVLNACMTPQFEQLGIDCVGGSLSMEEYVRRKERIEYDNFAEHHRIAVACSTGVGAPWRNSTDFFARYVGGSFEDYLKRAIAGGHTKNYEDAWKTHCKDAYDAAHPPKK